MHVYAFTTLWLCDDDDVLPLSCEYDENSSGEEFPSIDLLPDCNETKLLDS